MIYRSKILPTIFFAFLISFSSLSLASGFDIEFDIDSVMPGKKRWWLFAPLVADRLTIDAGKKAAKVVEETPRAVYNAACDNPKATAAVCGTLAAVALVALGERNARTKECAPITSRRSLAGVIGNNPLGMLGGGVVGGAAGVLAQRGKLHRLADQALIEARLMKQEVGTLGKRTEIAKKSLTDVELETGQLARAVGDNTTSADTLRRNLGKRSAETQADIKRAQRHAGALGRNINGVAAQVSQAQRAAAEQYAIQQGYARGTEEYNKVVADKLNILTGLSGDCATLSKARTAVQADTLEMLRAVNGSSGATGGTNS